MKMHLQYINYFNGQRKQENVLSSRTSITSSNCLFFRRRQNIICRITKGMLRNFSFIYHSFLFEYNKGKIIKFCLKDGNLEVYFRLAEQFRTQDDPAFCGLSTLTMVLNSLAVDPKKVWKGVWRW